VDTVSLLTFAATIVATLFGVLIAVLGWMGNKLYEKVSEMARSMLAIERDLHGQIANLDRRVTRLEDHVSI
jgi:cell division protein FtsB